MYDEGRLELLPHLEPQWREEVAHAVAHLGLIGALRRLAPAGAEDPRGAKRAPRGDTRGDTAVIPAERLEPPNTQTRIRCALALQRSLKGLGDTKGDMSARRSDAPQ
jgi:hypothetical protein